jgi:hypothetical protein
MVYEHLLECLIPKDPSSRFLEIFQAAITIAHGDTSELMALILGLVWLTMAKDTTSLCPITICEMFLQLISHSIVL